MNREPGYLSSMPATKIRRLLPAVVTFEDGFGKDLIGAAGSSTRLAFGHETGITCDLMNAIPVKADHTEADGDIRPHS